MKNGLLQFSQAMSSGTVHAEEFNSILENMPEVANRIAGGLGYVGRAAPADGRIRQDHFERSI
jgi:tape measure domain-containing protein